MKQWFRSIGCALQALSHVAVAAESASGDSLLPPAMPTVERTDPAWFQPIVGYGAQRSGDTAARSLAG